MIFFHRPRFNALGLAGATLTMAACSSVVADQRAPVARVAAARAFEPASVLVPRGATCSLHAEGADGKDGVRVVAEEDGVARFHARRATTSSTVTKLALDCADPTGATSTFQVDLTSDKTFEPRPFDMARAGGAHREALTGDPMSYSNAELIRRGFGPRPDATKDPGGYERWLRAASVPVRFVGDGRPTAGAVTQAREPVSANKAEPVGAFTTVVMNGGWAGSELDGYWQANPTSYGYPASAGTGAYAYTSATFYVPAVIQGGDALGNTPTHAAIWNGLGGGANQTALIQGGIQVIANANSVSYLAFREYCCGSPASNNYTAPFTPVPGHLIYSAEWYCAADGSINVNGGYGCSIVEDLDTGVTLSCTQASGSPCASVPALPGWRFGGGAEFITELQDVSFPDFASAFTISGSAGVTFGSSSNIAFSSDISNDPAVRLWQIPQTEGVLEAFLGSGAATTFQTESQNWTARTTSPFITEVATGGGGATWAISNQVAASYGVAGNDYDIYQLTNGAWSQVAGGAQHVTVDGHGVPWVVNHAGTVYEGNQAGGWVPVSWSPVMTQIAAGGGAVWGISNEVAKSYGGAGSDYAIYQLVGGRWTRMSGGAQQIAADMNGSPYVANHAGVVFSGDGNGGWNVVSTTPFITHIGVANSVALWGISNEVARSYGGAGNDYDIYRLINGAWGRMPGGGTKLAVSPFTGHPWVVNHAGTVYEGTP